MDVVQAVNALAMASAVAWADWVMGYCRVGSVAMSQMVRKTWEHEKWGSTKMIVSPEPSGRLLSNLHTTFLMVSANCR